MSDNFSKTVQGHLKLYYCMNMVGGAELILSVELSK
jgi:hypothetical protein